MITRSTRFFLAAAIVGAVGNSLFSAELPWVVVAPDQNGFVLAGHEKPFSPWGFNYDHDQDGRLIEDYWDADWEKVERYVHAMKALGANVVRIHLQLGQFMESTEKPNEHSLARLKKLVALAE